jgi:peptide/nickel transport system substrate-binding protein
MYSDTPTHNLNLVIYNRLYDLSPTGELRPDLAVDMPLIEENGTKYTIRIRQGVRFHNGNLMTIDDVIFSYNRGAFHERSQMKSIFAMMYDVEKIDDFTFSFRTGQFDASRAPAGVTNESLTSFAERGRYYTPVPFGSQTNQLSWLGASIKNKAALERAETDGTLRDYGLTWAIGTGPFKFVRWDEGHSVTLERFTDYFDQTIATNVDRLIFLTIRDPSALKSAFINREVDLIMNVVPLDARELEGRGANILTTAGYFGYHYLGFNMNSPRVGQVNADGTPNRSGVYNLNSNSARLRMAIFHAVNPRDIVDSPDIMDGRGIVTLQYVETLPFGRITEPAGTRLQEGSTTTGYFNAARARELFESLPASYRQPGSLRLTALSGSVHVRQALVIKDQVRRVLGVDLINIEQVALSELATRRRNSDPNVWDLLVNWTQTDDSYYIFVAFDGFNTSLLQDTKYYTLAAQEWIELGNSLPNGPERHIAYQNAHRFIIQDAPRLPLVAHMGISASQANITGVTLSPSGSFRLSDAVKSAN